MFAVDEFIQLQIIPIDVDVDGKLTLILFACLFLCFSVDVLKNRYLFNRFSRAPNYGLSQ